MSVIHWLLDSDPAIRWQAMRDLTEPEWVSLLALLLLLGRQSEL